LDTYGSVSSIEKLPLPAHEHVRDFDDRQKAHKQAARAAAKSEKAAPEPRPATSVTPVTNVVALPPPPLVDAHGFTEWEKRKLAECVVCREVKRIAAHGMCAGCYKAAERLEADPERGERIANRDERAKLKVQDKQLKAVTSLLHTVSANIDVLPRDVVDTIRAKLQPLLARQAAILPTVETLTQEATDLDIEQEDEVHSSQVIPDEVPDAPEADIDDSEQQDDVHSPQTQSTAQPTPRESAFENPA
jgi:hypothetical protein